MELLPGLQEVVEIDYLESRIDQIEYLGQKLREAGIAISEPVGGMQYLLMLRDFLSHIPQEHFPGQALCVELYLEAGVRGVEIGTVLAGRDPKPEKHISGTGTGKINYSSKGIYIQTYGCGSTSSGKYI